MVINHIKHEFDVETQTEMFDLIKHLANCESFERGVKSYERPNRIIISDCRRVVACGNTRNICPRII